nr:MAG TPA: hypothetical protein [Caudoviricetes sp.]
MNKCGVAGEKVPAIFIMWRGDLYCKCCTQMI